MTTHVDYRILGNRDQLAATMAVCDNQTIAAAAHCTVDTVEQWQARFGLVRPELEPEPEPPKVDRHALFRELVGRAYWRNDRCWAHCPGRETCLEKGCRYGKEGEHVSF